MSHVHIHFYGITLHVMKFVKQANGKLGNVLPVRSSELGRRGDHRREVHSCLHNKGPCLCPCPCHSPCPHPREDGKDVEVSSVLVAWSTGLAVLVARRGIVTDRGSITVARLLVLVLVVLILIFVTEGPSAGTVRS